MKLNRIKAAWVNGKICIRQGLAKSVWMSPMENEDISAEGQVIAKFQQIFSSQQQSYTQCDTINTFVKAVVRYGLELLTCC